MPEILYRDDVNCFSVYRLRDVPRSVPCSGRTSLENWKRDGVEYLRNLGRRYFASYTPANLDGHHEESCVAVLDEHAGPLLAQSAPTFSVRRIAMCPIEIPAVDFHRANTKHLGAQHGERQIPSAVRDASPKSEARDSAAWSAHLRCLVNQSAQRDREREATMSGWDPYGDD